MRADGSVSLVIDLGRVEAGSRLDIYKTEGGTQESNEFSGSLLQKSRAMTGYVKVLCKII